MESQVTVVLEDIAEKLAAGEALSRDDAERLLATKDLIAVGILADEARRRINGDRVTFLRVVDVAPTGTLPLIPADAGEVRISGLQPDREGSIDRIREVARVAGDVPVSVCALHELSGRLADRLRGAGASFVAEAAVDRLLDRSVLNDVRSAGLEVARWTVQSYDPLPPLDLLEQVRDLDTIPSFAPLSRVIDPSAPTTGYDDVKIVAVARLFLADVRSISVDWALYGPKLAQVALTFGADDLDGVPADAGGVNLVGPRRTPLEDVKRNIRAAALSPVQRDLRFRPLS
jgi:aminodeoxyfutalosine synthase